MFEEDAAFVTRFLEKHKANELAEKFLQARDRLGEQLRAETAASGEMRSWTINGSPRQGRVTGFSFQGMTLADPEGKAWRTSFQKISDDDNRYLHQIADSQAAFQPIKIHLKPIFNASAPSGPVGGGFNPRNPIGIPGANPPFPQSQPNFPQPNFPRPVMPNIPAPQPIAPFNPPVQAGQQQVLVAICENCKREISNSIKAGDRCPHCNTYFEYEVNADGSKTYAPGHEVGQWIGIGVCAVLMIAGLARRFGGG